MHEEFPSLSFHDVVLLNPLDYSHVSPMYLQPSPSTEYYIDVPMDNSMICYTDLGCEDNIFNMLGGNVDDYLSQGY